MVVRDGLTKEAKRKERCFEVKTQQESKTYEVITNFLSFRNFLVVLRKQNEL